jgi:hypothetical protein
MLSGKTQEQIHRATFDHIRFSALPGTLTNTSRITDGNRLMWHCLTKVIGNARTGRL